MLFHRDLLFILYAGKIWSKGEDISWENTVYPPRGTYVSSSPSFTGFPSNSLENCSCLQHDLYFEDPPPDLSAVQFTTG